MFQNSNSCFHHTMSMPSMETPWEKFGSKFLDLCSMFENLDWCFQHTKSMSRMDTQLSDSAAHNIFLSIDMLFEISPGLGPVAGGRTETLDVHPSFVSLRLCKFSWLNRRDFRSWANENEISLRLMAGAYFSNTSNSRNISVSAVRNYI